MFSEYRDSQRGSLAVLGYQVYTDNQIWSLSDREQDNQERYRLFRSLLGLHGQVPVALGQRQLLLPPAQQTGLLTSKNSDHSLYLLTIASLERPEKANLTSNGYNSRAISQLRLITQAILDLTHSGQLTANDFESFLEPVLELDDGLAATLNQGLELFFSFHYLPATYVLTLQIEDLIRQLIKYYGQDMEEYTVNGLEKRPLGRCLPLLEPYLAAQAYQFIGWVMKDYQGLNLRNAVAHGLIKQTSVPPSLSVSLIQTLCLLVNLLHQPPNEAGVR